MATECTDDDQDQIVLDHKSVVHLNRLEAKLDTMISVTYACASELADCRKIVEAIADAFDGMTIVLVPKVA